MKFCSNKLLIKTEMKYFKRTVIYPAMVGIPLLFSMCNPVEELKTMKDTLTDSLKIVVATPEFKTFIHFEFVDAKTGDYLYSGTQNVSVKVTGKDANNVYNTLGEGLDTYKSLRGMLDLVIDPHFVDSVAMKTNPIEFLVNASYPGYSDYSKKVFISENEVSTVKIALVNLSDAPEGVSVNTNANFATAGSDGKVANTSVATLNGGSTSVEVPKDIILKDANGNVVSGTVKSEIVFYNPAKDGALNAFPGGLDVDATLNGGTKGAISFSSAGLFSIDMSADGKDVRQFSNGGVKLSTKIDPMMINPKTGNVVAEGDQIEMWSMEPETGQWVFEKMATVKKVGSDLILEETIQHLSYWNWDWYGNSCYTGAKIKWTGNADAAYVHITTNRSKTYGWYTYTYQTYAYVVPNNPYYGETQFYRVPQNMPTTFNFEGYGQYANELTFNPSTLTINNLCDGQSYPVEVNLKGEYITVNTDITVVCKTSYTVRFKPNVVVYYKPTDKYYWSYIRMINGVASMKIKIGTDYDVYGYFGNASGYGKLKVENGAIANTYKITMTPTYTFKSGSQTPTSETQVITVPKPATNVVTIAGGFDLPSDVCKKFGF